jgi:hypothetical protein
LEFAMGAFGEDQPDPDGSPGGQALKSVVDHLGSLWINALDLLQPGSGGLELFEAGDVRFLKGLPGTDGQEQPVEGIIRAVGAGARHRAHLLVVDQGLRREATCLKRIKAPFIPDA